MPTKGMESEATPADVLAVDVSPRRAAVLPEPSPWIDVPEGARYAGNLSVKTIWRACRDGKLRHARVGGRREIRLRREFIDQWLESTITPIEVRR